MASNDTHKSTHRKSMHITVSTLSKLAFEFLATGMSHFVSQNGWMLAFSKFIRCISWRYCQSTYQNITIPITQILNLPHAQVCTILCYCDIVIHMY